MNPILERIIVIILLLPGSMLIVAAAVAYHGGWLRGVITLRSDVHLPGKYYWPIVFGLYPLLVLIYLAIDTGFIYKLIH